MSRTKSSGCRSSGAEWEPFVLTAAQPPVEEWGAAALVPYSQKLEPNAPLRNTTHHIGRGSLPSQQCQRHDTQKHYVVSSITWTAI